MTDEENYNQDAKRPDKLCVAERVDDRFGIGCSPESPDPFGDERRTVRNLFQATFDPFDPCAPSISVCQPDQQDGNCLSMSGLKVAVVVMTLIICRRLTCCSSPCSSSVIECLKMNLKCRIDKVLCLCPAIRYFTFYNISCGFVLGLLATAIVLLSTGVIRVLRFLERMTRTAFLVQMLCIGWMVYKFSECTVVGNFFDSLMCLLLSLLSNCKNCCSKLIIVSK